MKTMLKVCLAAALLLGSMPSRLAATEAQPRALVVQKKDGTRFEFPLSKTQFTIQKQDGNKVFHVEFIGGEGFDCKLSEIEFVTYASELSGINSVVYSTTARIEVYRIDGVKVMSSEGTLQQVIDQLPKGIYLVKVNGETLKIAR